MDTSIEIRPKQHFEGLDALRGVAILSVIGSHYFYKSFLLRFGWVGVDFFFVLSGFLITHILINTRNSKHFFLNFYARRALRIFPLYYLSLGFFYFIITLYNHESRYDFYLKNWHYYLLYSQNWLFVLKGLPAENHLNHLWSLAVEEHFYFLWPVVIFFIKNKQRIIQLLWTSILIILVVRIFVWASYGQRVEVYYCNTFTRMDSIAFGCLLGCGFLLSKEKLYLIFIISFLALILGIVFFKNSYFTSPFFGTVGYSIVALISVCLLQIFINTPRKFQWLRKNRVLNFIGRISYGLYIIHVPAYLFIKGLLSAEFNKSLVEEDGEIIIALLSLSATLTLSIGSYYLFELKFLKLKKYFPAFAQ